MSMHKIPLTQLEEDGLRAHGLDIGSPSQLSDVFRHGIKWALEQTAPQPEQSEQLEEFREIVDGAVLMCEGGDLCTEEGLPLPAVRMMPQSCDGGATHVMVPCCANHVNGWWDGADWEGQHLEYDVMINAPSPAQRGDA